MMTDRVWTERQSGEANQRPNDHRDPFQRDRARILHSAAFRRLQSKTQILGVGTDDFYRTRLTHSLEVAQIGTGLTAQLRQSPELNTHNELRDLLPSDALIESLCLAHDLGHPPFGHGGEIALNFMMRDQGGFEANGQTFRIASRLEPYTESFGMDLTRRTLLGLIKYPHLISNQRSKTQQQFGRLIKAHDWKPIKGLLKSDEESFKWVLSSLSEADQTLFSSTTDIEARNPCFIAKKSLFKSLDCSIMEIADDIAYGVHDLEDAIALNKVTQRYWDEEVLPGFLESENPWAVKHAAHLTQMLFSREHHQRKNAIGALVNHLITNITLEKRSQSFSSPLLQYQAVLNRPANSVLKLLKMFVYKHVIQDTELQQNEYRGQQMLIALFEAFSCDPMRLLPNSVQLIYQQCDLDITQSQRVICDYLAGMSDEHACRIHSRLFG